MLLQRRNDVVLTLLQSCLDVNNVVATSKRRRVLTGMLLLLTKILCLVAKNGGFVVDPFDFIGVAIVGDFCFLYFPCLLFCCFIEIRCVFLFLF